MSVTRPQTLSPHSLSAHYVSIPLLEPQPNSFPKRPFPRIVDSAPVGAGDQRLEFCKNFRFKISHKLVAAIPPARQKLSLGCRGSTKPSSKILHARGDRLAQLATSQARLDQAQPCDH